MSCSICGKSGHNAKTCPKSNKKGYALWVKIDNITENEATDLLTDIMKSKSKIAPEGRGTFAKASKKDLPIEIKNVLNLEDNNGSKKRQ